MQSDHELIKALQNDNIRSVDNFFLSMSKIKITGPTLLAAVVHNNYENSIRTLRNMVRHKVDINYQDEQGKSALMFAVETGRIETIRLLAKYENCNPNIECKDGTRAIHIAVKKDDDRILSLLINTNFYPYLLEVNCPDKRGKTPLNLASERDHSKCAVILWNEGLADTSVLCREFPRKCSIQSITLDGLQTVDPESKKSTIDNCLLSPRSIHRNPPTEKKSKKLNRSNTENHTVYLSKKILNRVKSVTPKLEKKETLYTRISVDD
ncbi:unnamed protein product [Dimorphilus gyrociliatus]|uniref:Uncharacterized protein n=1 Tax=Dimorphilus gyrociliatus TaxID=2664684 RepID=A0A7I8WBQ6_9ANNE|nr:unnamed protein product [Dimorphilus gyrociliatus]